MLARSASMTSLQPFNFILAELGTPHDFRDRRTVCPQGFHLLNHGERKYRLGTEPNASRLGLVDAVLLAPQCVPSSVRTGERYSDLATILK